MKRVKLGAAVVLLSTVGLVAAACTPPPPPVAPNINFNFVGTNVVALDQTEHFRIFGTCGFGSNCYDEPYLINIWFRVKIGVPGSADAGVVSTRAFSPEIEMCKAANIPPCAAGSNTKTLTTGAGGSGGLVQFSGVPAQDVGYLLANPTDNKVEVVGVWSWAMEEDLIGTPLPGSLATTIKNALNATLAVGTLPGDLNDLAQIIVDNLGNAISVGGAALADALSDFLFGFGDDTIGSRFFVFVGAGGTLASIINAATPSTTPISANLTLLGIPDIQGFSIKATSNLTLSQTYTGSGAQYTYDYASSVS